MRAIITKGGFPTFINIRESEFLDSHFNEDIIVEKKTFNEREAHIAQNLVSRGILDKVVNQGTAGYKLNINNYGKL
jgi:hypothetical protein|tara:strand:- start:1148 stop:1375 length:228 start_codon:yes stop_codon:yes gene_type:complete